VSLVDVDREREAVVPVIAVPAILAGPERKPMTGREVVVVVVVVVVWQALLGTMAGPWPAPKCLPAR
jgi:hypothetical protein